MKTEITQLNSAPETKWKWALIRGLLLVLFIECVLGTPAQEQEPSVIYTGGSETSLSQKISQANNLRRRATAAKPFPAETVALTPRSTHCSFRLRGERRSLIEEVLRAYGIKAILDDSLGGKVQAFDVDDVDFVQATELLRLTTGAFLVPLDAKSALVVLDTKGNRRKHEHQIERAIYLPALSASEMNDLQNLALRVFAFSPGIGRDNQGRMIVRGSEREVGAFESLSKELFSGKSDLGIDVHVFEVERSVNRNTGTVLPNSVTAFNVRSEINSIIASNSSLVQQIIASGLAGAGDYSAILAALLASGELTGTVFNDPFVLFGGGLTETGVEWNSTSASLLLNSSETHSLSEAYQRVTEGGEGIFRNGQRYPIVTSTYTGLSTDSSGSSAKTVPQIQYQDLGFTLKIKPVLESEDKVALNVDLKVTSLAGSTLNNLPVLTNRQYAGTVCVRFGNSALITSAISRQDLYSIAGLPGLGEISEFRNTESRQSAAEEMELVVMVTPTIVRLGQPQTVGAMKLLSESTD